MSEIEERKQELRKTLKKKIMDRVVDNGSNDDIHAIVALNAMFVRMRKMLDIPEEHVEEINHIRQEEKLDRQMQQLLKDQGIDPGAYLPEPRAIKQLNMLEKLKGNKMKWSARSSFDMLINTPSPSDSIN